MTKQLWTVSEESLTRVAPHRLSGRTNRDVIRAWFFAACLVGASGVVWFGPAALKVLLLSIVSAVAVEIIIGLATRRPAGDGLSKAALIGLLFGLTLPATVPGDVVAFGAIISILVGRMVFGGLLHPALIGRVIVQFFFSMK